MSIYNCTISELQHFVMQPLLLPILRAVNFHVLILKIEHTYVCRIVWSYIIMSKDEQNNLVFSDTEVPYSPPCCWKLRIIITAVLAQVLCCWNINFVATLAWYFSPSCDIAIGYFQTVISVVVNHLEYKMVSWHACAALDGCCSLVLHVYSMYNLNINVITFLVVWRMSILHLWSIQPTFKLH